MLLINKILTFSVSVIITISVLVLSGCGGPMHLVQKSIEQGDLVSAQAVTGMDFLNEYSHPLMQAKSQLLDVDIAFERKAVMVNGDRIFMQLGLVTQAATIDPVDLHVLVYNPVETSGDDQKRMLQSLTALLQSRKQFPQIASLTIDSLRPLQGLSYQSLIKEQKATDLVRFVRQYARRPAVLDKQHYIVMLGDMGSKSRLDLQHVVDLAGVLRVKGATVSVFSVEDNPQVAFARQAAASGHGLVSFLTKKFDYNQWLRNELYHVNATKLSDIKVTLNMQYGATIREIVSPQSWNQKETEFVHHIPELVQGDQYVVLTEINTPLYDPNTFNEIVSVNVEYFDESSRMYHKISKTGRVDFAMDRNQLSQQKNPKVERSMLIVNTQKTIIQVEPMIRDKRYYKAIADLTEHGIHLQRFAAKHADKELQRDATILNAYTEQLYNFSEKTFQSFKIWKDLSWDESRFTDSYL